MLCLLLSCVWFLTLWTVSSAHEIFQARILEWVAIPFSEGSSWHRDQSQVSSIAGRFFTIWATRKAHWSFHVLIGYLFVFRKVSIHLLAYFLIGLFQVHVLWLPLGEENFVGMNYNVWVKCMKNWLSHNTQKQWNWLY